MKEIIKNSYKNFYSIIENGYFAYGLLFAGWSPVMIVLGYWIEELIHYFLTAGTLLVFKIRSREQKSYLLFFIFSYGMFAIVHGIFVLILAGISSKSSSMAKELFEAIFRIATGRFSELSDTMASELVLLFAVVGISSVSSFYMRFFHKRSKDLSCKNIVNGAFGPIVLPHILIIFGIGAIVLFDLPSLLSIAVIIAKVLVDILGWGEGKNEVFNDI